MDFRAELDKLLAMEDEFLPYDGLADVAKEIILRFDKKQTDISMQVEEIYDLVQETDTTALQEIIRDGKKRETKFLRTVLSLCDMIEDFKEYAAQWLDGEIARQAMMMWRGTDRLLMECGITRVSGSEDVGQPMDPSIHTVQTTAHSPYPREYVAQVLRSGYGYNGDVVRKASIIVSSGSEGVNE